MKLRIGPLAVFWLVTLAATPSLGGELSLGLDQIDITRLIGAENDDLALLLFRPPAAVQSSGSRLGGSTPESSARGVDSQRAGSLAPRSGELRTGEETGGGSLQPTGGFDRALHRRIGASLADLALAPGRMTRRHWRNLGLASLAVAAVSVLDEDIRDLTRGHPAAEDLALTIRPIGRDAGLGVLAATWLAADQLGAERLGATMEDAIQAVVVTGVVTGLLKEAAGRSRPIHGEGSGSFARGEESFPSGDVAQAFAISATIAGHSDRKWVDALSWTYAGLIGWERMQLDAHWASDVVAGALIGVAIGRWVVRRNHARRGPEWSVAPRLGEGVVGFQASLGF